MNKATRDHLKQMTKQAKDWTTLRSQGHVGTKQEKFAKDFVKRAWSDERDIALANVRLLKEMLKTDFLPEDERAAVDALCLAIGDPTPYPTKVQRKHGAPIPGDYGYAKNVGMSHAARVVQCAERVEDFLKTGKRATAGAASD